MADPIDLDAIRVQREKIIAEARAKIKKDKEESEAYDDNMPPESQIPYKNRDAAEEKNSDLKEMNTKYAFVHNYGGKNAIMMMLYSELHKKEVTSFISVDSLYPIYQNRIAIETEGNKNRMTVAKWWMAHAHRKEYVGITFEPEKPPGPYHVIDKYKVERAKHDRTKTEDIYMTYYNMWEGLALTPKKGSWKKLKKHIYEVLCNKDKKKFKYVLKWLAFAVQMPGKRAEVALIFKGKKGAGKGAILQSMVEIFGPHGLTISNREHLTGKHNQHLAETVFLYADEAYYPGDKEIEGILKNLITEERITTEPKFKEVRVSKNCLHIVMATNAEWIIPATEDERRYFINEVDNKYAKGQCPDDVRERYFKELWIEKDNGGLAAMLYDLLRINLTNWHPRNSVPTTKELRKQIAMSLPKLKLSMLQILEDGVFPGHLSSTGEYRVTSSGLLNHIHDLDPGNKNINVKSLTNLLKSLDLVAGRTGSQRYWIFPEIGLMRAMWDERVSKHSDWNDAVKWEENKEF